MPRGRVLDDYASQYDVNPQTVWRWGRGAKNPDHRVRLIRAHGLLHRVGVGGIRGELMVELLAERRPPTPDSLAVMSTD